MDIDIPKCSALWVKLPKVIIVWQTQFSFIIFLGIPPLWQPHCFNILIWESRLWYFIETETYPTNIKIFFIKIYKNAAFLYLVSRAISLFANRPLSKKTVLSTCQLGELKINIEIAKFIAELMATHIRSKEFKNRLIREAEEHYMKNINVSSGNISQYQNNLDKFSKHVKGYNNYREKYMSKLGFDIPNILYINDTDISPILCHLTYADSRKIRSNMQPDSYIANK
ncbi:hypothetical protein [Francisella frigiditurris]|uniref:Uncharacterized protein n=1 Tax=Francisella frigiditurris TaxID=1542390 RepID=A0A1J0KWB1_9GAMM|nr:hypothetical protein [Francisella frigiditurris]APC97902.1 hypothetical protein KX01_320 [Francisella frigiditurris]